MALPKKFHRKPNEKAAGIPHELECLQGACGPWIKSDTIEWRHLNTETQECLVRMSPEDVADWKECVSDYVRRRTIKKWVWRVIYATGGAFGAVYAAGEKFVALWQLITSLGFDPIAFLLRLKGLVG